MVGIDIGCTNITILRLDGKITQEEKKDLKLFTNKWLI